MKHYREIAGRVQLYREYSMVEKLEAALAAAFPEITIDRTMINEPTADWSSYPDRADLAAFEARTWQELPAELLVSHSTLPVYAGDNLFRATLPGYLRYLLHERRHFNNLPFQLAAQLTRKGNPDPKFDRRIAPFSQAQRGTIRAVLSLLATVSPMEETMARALVTWNKL
jgi:hypothetical protein